MRGRSATGTSRCRVQGAPVAHAECSLHETHAHTHVHFKAMCHGSRFLCCQSACRRPQWTVSLADLAMYRLQISARASAFCSRCRSLMYSNAGVLLPKRARHKPCTTLSVGSCIAWQHPHATAQCYGQQLRAAAAGQQRRVALDCGSGVGRIAEQLLLQHFQEVGSFMVHLDRA
jgi:AdoMet dependent proline di-methyltransferase